jgi:hypothetical protein
MTATLDALRARQAHLIAADGGELFMGLPDRWLDDPHWRCANGHVSRRFLSSEVRGDLCLACQTPVLLTCPEDIGA